MDKNKVLLCLAVFTTLFFWSSAFVGIRYTVSEFHPGSMALLRFLSASVCILLYYVCNSKKHKIAQKQKQSPRFINYLVLVLAGISGLAIYNIALNQGEQHVAAGVASFIIAQAPIFTAIICFLVLKEKINRFGLIGLAVSTIGVSIIAYENTQTIELSWGILAVLIAAISAAIYFSAQSYLKTYFTPFYVTAYSIFASTILLAILYSGQLLVDIKHVPTTSTAIVIYLGIFPTAVAYATWNYALSQKAATQITSFMYCMPILVTLEGWLFINEATHLAEFVGGCIAVAGTMILTNSKRLAKSSNG